MHSPKFDQSGGSSKKRKCCSDAERMATELSKMKLSHEINCKFRVDQDRIFFPETECRFNHEHCTWRNSKTAPYYCSNAHLKFETTLPDRKYLTRFSVQCPECYDAGAAAVHLHCAYCDEIITGSIAEPGGKISDHLITIRHVYQQALALMESLESGSSKSISLAVARVYVIRLEEWSEQVRYPMRTAVKRIHVEQVLQAFRRHLARFFPPQATVQPAAFLPYCSPNNQNCGQPVPYCEAVFRDFLPPLLTAGAASCPTFPTARPRTAADAEHHAFHGRHPACLRKTDIQNTAILA